MQRIDQHFDDAFANFEDQFPAISQFNSPKSEDEYNQTIVGRHEQADDQPDSSITGATSNDVPEVNNLTTKSQLEGVFEMTRTSSRGTSEPQETSTSHKGDLFEDAFSDFSPVQNESSNIDQHQRNKSSPKSGTFICRPVSIAAISYSSRFIVHHSWPRRSAVSP